MSWRALSFIRGKATAGTILSKEWDELEEDSSGDSKQGHPEDGGQTPEHSFLWNGLCLPTGTNCSAGSLHTRAASPCSGTTLSSSALPFMSQVHFQTLDHVHALRHLPPGLHTLI